jgi:cell division protein FtsW (lipid II flippase)
LLCAIAIIAGCGGLLLCHTLDIQLHHASRLILVPGAVIIATFLLDRIGPKRDHVLIACALGLSAIGLLTLWRLELGAPASDTTGLRTAGTRQMVWMLVGTVALVATYGLIRDIRRLANYKYLCGAAAIGLIVATMLRGHEVNGAKLWIGIENLIRFQPTELAKVLFCIFLAGYIAAKGDMLTATGPRFLGISVPEMRYLAPLLLVAIFSLAVFVLQRDLGAAVLIYGVFLALLYLATGRRTYGALGAGIFIAGGVAADRMFPHVHRRIEAWLNPWATVNDSGWQIAQSLFCFAEGGVFGRGLGNGLPVPGQLPAAHTDLILAVIGEELGMAGVIAIMLLSAFISYRGFSIAWQARDRFGGLLAAALSTAFALQTLVIVGGVTKLVPLTGITLPFVSYGGTSVLMSFISLGLLLCISRDCIHRASDESEGQE